MYFFSPYKKIAAQNLTKLAKATKLQDRTWNRMSTCPSEKSSDLHLECSYMIWGDQLLVSSKPPGTQQMWVVWETVVNTACWRLNTRARCIWIQIQAQTPIGA